MTVAKGTIKKPTRKPACGLSQFSRRKLPKSEYQSRREGSHGFREMPWVIIAVPPTLDSGRVEQDIRQPTPLNH